MPVAENHPLLTNHNSPKFKNPTRTATDALGRVTLVVEDYGHSALMTKYGYDALGNLTSVLKCPAGGCGSGGQSRTFKYDGLSRLTQATNPESGTVTYSYLLNGVPKSKVQSRSDNRSSNNLTTYSYDALDRVTGITYNDGTPSASYTFDARGNLTIANSGTVSNQFTYDVANRPLTSTLQIGSGSTYNTTYQYDLADNLVKETYPSGRLVVTTFDQVPRAQSVSGTLSGTTTNYVRQAGYYPTGDVNYWQYGNNIWPSETYIAPWRPNSQFATVNNDNSRFLLFLQSFWNNNGTVGSATDCYGAG